MAYRLKYIQTLPKVGSLCPECGIDIIRKSQYSNNRVYCRTCKIVWEQQKASSKFLSLATKDDIENIRKEIGLLREQMTFYKDLTKQLLDALQKFEGNVYLLTKIPPEEDKLKDITLAEEEEKEK